MILGQIYQSRTSWQKLSGMKMRPQVAYKILGYTRKIDAEFDLIERQRVSALRRVSGIESGDVNVEEGTPEFEAFVKEFNEVLVTESDLRKFSRKLSCVLNAVADGQDDILTVTDLALLSPFFQEEDDEVQ
jgi:hypothetical protein